MIVLVLPDIPEEDALLTAARQGQEAAVMQIYESYFPPIYEYIRLRVNDRHEAEDLASEVFLKFVKALHGPNAPRHSLRGWLFKVARNAIATHHVKIKQQPEIELEEWFAAPTDQDPEIIFLRNLSTHTIHEAMRRLTTEQQEVLVLRFGQQLSLEETADIMGKSIGAIKTMQFRAVESMRRSLNAGRKEESYG